MATKIIENRFNLEHEIRIDEENRTIHGYAAVFDVEERIGDRFIEKIARGAFTDSIKDGKVRALWNHNTDLVIGNTGNGSLTLVEDKKGLRFDLKLPKTTWGNDAHILIRDEFVTGVSFGFRVQEETWERGEEGKPHVRTLNKVELLEISPTAFPAYEETQVSARSSEDALKEKEIEWAHIEKEQNERINRDLSEINNLRNRLDLIDLDNQLRIKSI